MTNAYYIQEANEIFPIFGASSIEEAKKYVDDSDANKVIETSESVYMNIETGSVDFSSGWDFLEGLVEVVFDCELECWVEA